MAKSDLLKEAIADAKAVKETALANAKLALQEAFAPRIRETLMAELEGDLEDEEAVDVDVDAEAPMGDEEGAGMGDMPDSVNVGLDFNDDGDYDLTGIIGGEEEELPAEEETEENPEEMNAEYNEGMYEGDYGHTEEDLNLEAIIRELEEDLEQEPMSPEEEEVEDVAADIAVEGMYHETDEDPTDPYSNESIDEIIEAILREDEMSDNTDGMGSEEVEALQAEVAEKQEELKEAYRTVKQLKSIINEVNLLNAKLLYTNKLFRNFELSEGQKMKVIENFDRAGNTREVKLVFSTLAESFNKPKAKRVVKESLASKPVRTTAPSKKTTQVLSEGFEMANRWKKLAGLI
jgi:hypothetical protein